jgi:5'-3' exonuclease
MGVPALFSFLSKNYKEIVFYKRDYKMDNLYIDGNGLIHPCCYSTLDKYPDWEQEDWIEEKMMKEIVRYLDYIISFVNPKQLIYISIDGSAPQAKMKQQRSRRYKSYKEKALVRDLKKRLNVKVSKPWNSTKITPGTNFMRRVKGCIQEYILKNKRSKFKNIRVIFSGSNVPQEGEHKLYQHIRDLKNKRLKCCIHGLDADLIFLGLASKRDNVFLIREKDYLDNRKSEGDSILVYLSIDILKKNLVNEIDRKMKNYYSELGKKTIDKEMLVTDFIIYCFFLGNDFLPHLPSLKIKEDGIPTLINIYVQTYLGIEEPLISRSRNSEGNPEINSKFLKIMIQGLADIETRTLKKFLKKEKRYKRSFDSRLEEELYKIKIAPKVNDHVKLGKDGYRKRYYSHYFDISFQDDSPKDIEDAIIDICQSYYDGIFWVMNYYLNRCSSWTWSYRYSHPPLLEDFDRYYSKLKIPEFKIGQPLKPFEQLLSVIPPTSSELLPKSYQKLMHYDNSPLLDLYPIDFKEDFIDKYYRWEGIPFLPNVDVNRIKTAVSKLKLSKEEKERNTLGKELIY